MRFGHIEIFVRDPLRAKAFYEQVLSFETVDIQGGRLVWMRLGKTEILLRPAGSVARAPQYQDAPVALVFYTDDFEATVEELREKGLEFLGTDGSEGYPTFTDPDGNWFQLVDPRRL